MHKDARAHTHTYFDTTIRSAWLRGVVFIEVTLKPILAKGRILLDNSFPNAVIYLENIYLIPVIQINKLGGLFKLMGKKITPSGEMWL